MDIQLLNCLKSKSWNSANPDLMEMYVIFFQLRLWKLNTFLNSINTNSKFELVSEHIWHSIRKQVSVFGQTFWIILSTSGLKMSSDYLNHITSSVEVSIQYLKDRGVLRRTPPICPEPDCGRSMSWIKYSNLVRIVFICLWRPNRPLRAG